MKSIAKKKKMKWRTCIPFYLKGLPGILYLIINNYMPMVGLQIAFKDYKYNLGIWDSPWAGLNNFKFLFKTGDAWIMIRNTILYNIVWIFLGMVVGVGAAILLNEIISKRAKKFYQTVILMPYLMSMVIVSYLVYAYLSTGTGLLTNIIEQITGNKISFYTEAKYWPFILTIVNQWKGIGFGMILYLSSIVGIDPALYEAAALDGATRGQQHRLITIPMLKPTIIMLMIMNVGGIFRSDFGLFYQVPMNQGALYSVTQTIDTYVYRALLQRNDVGMSSAASFIQSVVGFIFVVTVNQIVKKMDEKNSLF